MNFFRNYHEGLAVAIRLILGLTGRVPVPVPVCDPVRTGTRSMRDESDK